MGIHRGIRCKHNRMPGVGCVEDRSAYSVSELREFQPAVPAFHSEKPVPSFDPLHRHNSDTDSVPSPPDSGT